MALGCNLDLKWTPSHERWLKVNVDASWNKSGKTSTFVAHDHMGKLLYLSSKLTSADTPFLVEAQASCWAMDYIENNS